MIFDRQIQTRILCIFALLTWAVLLASLAFGAFYIWVLHTDGPVVGASQFLSVVFWVAILHGASLAGLWLWRRCDRCGRRLFAEGRRTLLSPSGRDNLPHWGRMLVDRERDYRARTLLGSYRTAAIAQMATSGRVRCQWCGHMDGDRPDYVVVSSEE